MAYLYDYFDFPYLDPEEALTNDGIYQGNVLINSKDALSNWGIILEKESFGILLAPAPLKPAIENNVPDEDGIEIYENPPIDKRNISLSLILVSKTQAEALTRLNSFIQELMAGRFTLKIPGIDNNIRYRLLYNSCTTYRPWFNGISKLIINVTEPNPAYRV